MRRAIISLLLLATVPALAFAQAHAQAPSRSPQRPDTDRLGMTCAQILKMPSAEWIAYFSDKAGVAALDASTGIARAIAVYGKCYDARTDSVASALAKSGKGPPKAARADFAGFEAALRDFTAQALADAPPAADSQRATFANLYEKQFRYAFYEEFEAKTARPAKPAQPAAKPPATAAAPAAAPPPATTSAAAGAAATTAQERARSDADPVTIAKNRFGKLLEVLPDDKMHELHRAFGDVIGTHQISEAMRLAVYRYAIFLLESPSATPPSEPPF